jgi:hypothetical protein
VADKPVGREIQVSKASRFAFQEAKRDALPTATYRQLPAVQFPFYVLSLRDITID